MKTNKIQVHSPWMGSSAKTLGTPLESKPVYLALYLYKGYEEKLPEILLCIIYEHRNNLVAL